MKTPGLHSPFIDGEVLGAAPNLRSPFEQVMPEPKAQPMPATAAAGLRVVDAKGVPLSGVAWSLHQGALELRGTLVAGEADVLVQGARSFDRSKPFRFHVEGHVCSIVSGAALLVDEPGVEYGGSLFDWRAADSTDPAARSAFWKDYAARRQKDTAPSVFRYIQHEHIMRRPVRWLKGTNLVELQAEPLSIRLGPLVRYTDHHQARIWLELSAPGLVRVHYGAAPDAKKKPTSTAVPAGVRTRHTCSVRVGGRHYAMLTLDELPADSVVMYTLELAPQPPTGPLPRTEIDFTEARFPRQLPKAALDPQQVALGAISISGSPWLFLRTLPQSGEALRFAHGSCRVHPDDTDENQQVQGDDMLARFGNDFLHKQELAAWPQFFMHTGDQIYADDIGVRLGKQIVRARHSATFPGPKQGHVLALGAWAGRFAPRYTTRGTVLPAPPAADIDAVDQQRNTSRDPVRVEAAAADARDALKQAQFQTRAMLPEEKPPAVQKLQVMNQLLWQPPIEASDVPQVDKRRGLLQAPTFRILQPKQRDVRLPYPAAGDIGGVHVADYAEYAAAYEQAWLVHGARRGLAHLPSYMIFDDHEVTDDWNADADWLACVHHPRDALGMWPATITDALAAYWLYQGWGNLEPVVAAADPRVQILERARHQGHDALPELRQLIHTRAVAPTDKKARPAARTNLLGWNFRVPTSGTPFVVLDLRTDREVHGKGGMSKARLDWLRTVLGAARTRSAFVVLPVPLLMPAPLAFAMQHEGVTKLATGARSKAEARRKNDLEHPIMNLVWAQFRELLRELQNKGSPLRTLAIVSGDIHFSCNLDGQLPGSTQGPRLLQLISSGLRKVIGPKKEGHLFDAYRGWLSVITRAQGVDERRGVRATVGGLEGPTPVPPGQGFRNPKQAPLKNFLFPTSVALVNVVPARTQPAGRVLGDTALITQWHLVGNARGGLDAWSFTHATRAEGGWMTLNDPGLAYADRPDTYPRDSRPMGLVKELLDELEPDGESTEAGDFELVHETLDGEVEPTLELITDTEPATDEAEASFEFGADGEGFVGEALDEAQEEAPLDEAPEGEEPTEESEVIGTDSRKVVADTLAVPYRWICALDIYYDTGPLGRDARHLPDHTRGSGVLIGPRHVLTAAHVLGPVPVKFDGVEYQLPVTRIVVTPARDGRNDKAPLGQSRRVWWGRPPPRGTVVRASLQDDYALLVVKDNLAAASHKRFKRLGYWGEDPQVSELRPPSAADLAGTITVAGYPGDTFDRTILPREQGADADDKLKERIRLARRNKSSTWAARMWESSGSLRRHVRHPHVLHDADTYPGNSGGPVFAQRDGVWCLLAVHGGPGSQNPQTHQVADNRAAPVTTQMLSQINDWMNNQGGRGTSSLVGGRLVPAAFVAPSRETADDAEDEGAAADESPAADEFESEDLAFEEEESRAAGVAATASLLGRGLRLAEAWLPRQPRSGVPELLRFAVSLLRTHFFPRGHGVIDARGQVHKQARVAQIAMRLRLRDGSPAPFEHRVRLWLSARSADRAVVAGRHSDAHFSGITLYAPAFAGLAPAAALQHAVHEMLHMLFTLVERLRQRHGDAMADAFLQKDPWKLLDLRRYAAWRDRLQQALGPLLHLLGSPEPAADAAQRLVEEAFCYTLAMHLRFTLETGSKSGIVESSVTETLVRNYLLDHSPRLSSLLGTEPLAQASAPLRTILNELQATMNAAWQGGTATPTVQPEALFEPF